MTEPLATTHTRTDHGVTRTEIADARTARVVGLRVRVGASGRAVGRALRRRWVATRAVVTPAGWAVGGWAVAALLLAAGWGWDEALVAGLVAAILVVAAVPFLVGRVPYQVEVALERDAVVAGEEALATVVVTNPGPRSALPGRVELPLGHALVEVAVPALRAGTVHTEPVEIPAQRRGVIAVGPAVTTRTDPLRLLERRTPWTQRRMLFVHPRTVSVPSTSRGWIRDLEGRVARTLTTEDISFHAVRPYERGDAPRHIHWGSTARTGTLMVRQFEETRRSLLTVILDLDAASYANDLEVEMAVSAAASLGVRAVRDGRDVEAVVGGEVPAFARASLRTLRTLRTATPRALLDDLTTVEASAATVDLPTVARMVGEADRGTALAILVTGSALSPQRLRTAAMHLPAGASVGAVICDPSSEPGTRMLAGIQVIRLGILEDLRVLLARGAERR